MSTASGDPVELVTVPALGAEWGRDEMRDMTKAARKEKKAEAWYRDERGLCGKWFTRKFLVFFVFGLCAVCVVAFSFLSLEI
jgi:hypothetical protein